jgi:hypothetical protein
LAGDSGSLGCTASRTPVDSAGIHCVARRAMTPSAMAPPMMMSVRDGRLILAGIFGGSTMIVPRARPDRRVLHWSRSQLHLFNKARTRWQAGAARGGDHGRGC